MTVTAHIGVMCSDGTPPGLFAEFERAVAASGLKVSVESTGQRGVFAGVEDWLPTIVVVWIGKAYFDAFLKEAGKDHYQVLRAALAKLYDKFASPEANARVTVYATQGKVKAIRKYSLLYSIYAEAESGLQMKLLMPCEQMEQEYLEMLTAFLTFLDNFHARALPHDQVELLGRARVSGKTCLLAYNPTNRRIEPYDPYESRL
jgi:hypothetical protein